MTGELESNRKERKTVDTHENTPETEVPQFRT